MGKFSFGENWKSFISDMDENSVQSAMDNISKWLESIDGKTVLDIGCGSGLQSFAFLRLGASLIISFDLDRLSVEATQALWEKVGHPSTWNIYQGSILDEAFLSQLPEVDIVYSWGTLHHTGSMWKAMENTLKFVKPGGRWWISIYVKGPNYERDLARKEQYNSASRLQKRFMEYRYTIIPIMLGRLKRRQNPLAWNQRRDRGMDTYHDMVDWLGGLPYEVASADEILQFASKHGLSPEKIETAHEGQCAVYLMRRKLSIDNLLHEPKTDMIR
jgi:2-polyprenyl-6-hydroxyphenyl methylase/3-demethylubiquinone-9 3-methyltransferase